MAKSSFSALRVFYIVSVVVVAFAIAVAVGPLERYISRLTRPVTIRPEISGVVYIHGVPTSGVQLRVASAQGDSFACNTLPVVAVTDATGSFHAPSEQKPSFLVKKSRWIPTDMCMTYGQTILFGVLWFVTPGKATPRQLVCRYPGMHTGYPPADQVCYDAP